MIPSFAGINHKSSFYIIQKNRNCSKINFKYQKNSVVLLKIKTSTKHDVVFVMI